MQDFVKIHPEDTVAVALRPLQKGMKLQVGEQEVLLREDILQGHKFALKKIAAGEEIVKYGATIGLAETEIEDGAWVHTHNLRTGLKELLEYTYSPTETSVKPGQARDFFLGYRRKDGKVGVRNEIWIIPTVGCVNSVAKAIEKQAQCHVQGSVEGVCKAYGL